MRWAFMLLVAILLVGCAAEDNGKGKGDPAAKDNKGAGVRLSGEELQAQELRKKIKASAWWAVKPGDAAIDAMVKAITEANADDILHIDQKGKVTKEPPLDKETPAIVRQQIWDNTNNYTLRDGLNIFIDSRRYTRKLTTLQALQAIESNLASAEFHKQ